MDINNLYNEMHSKLMLKLFTVKNRFIFKDLIFDLEELIDQAHYDYLEEYAEAQKTANSSITSEINHFKIKIGLWIQKHDFYGRIEYEDEDKDIFFNSINIEDGIIKQQVYYLYRQLTTYRWIKEQNYDNQTFIQLSQVAIHLISSFRRLTMSQQSQYKGYWKNIYNAFEELKRSYYDRDSCLGFLIRQRCGSIAECISYRSFDDIDVKFEDGYLLEHVTKENFCNGYLSNLNVIALFDEDNFSLIKYEPIYNMYSIFNVDMLYDNVEKYRKNLKEILTEISDRYESFSMASLRRKNDINDTLIDFKDNFFTSIFFKLLVEAKEIDVEPLMQKINLFFISPKFINRLEYDGKIFTDVTLEWKNEKEPVDVVRILAEEKVKGSIKGLEMQDAIDEVEFIVKKISSLLADSINHLNLIKNLVNKYIKVLNVRIKELSKHGDISFVGTLRDTLYQITNENMKVSLKHNSIIPLQFENLSKPKKYTIKTKAEMKKVISFVLSAEKQKEAIKESLKDARFSPCEVYKYVENLFDNTNEFLISKDNINTLYQATMYLLIVNYVLLDDCPYDIYINNNSDPIQFILFENNKKYMFIGTNDYRVVRKESLNERNFRKFQR